MVDDYEANYVSIGPDGFKVKEPGAPPFSEWYNQQVIEKDRLNEGVLETVDLNAPASEAELLLAKDRLNQNAKWYIPFDNDSNDDEAVITEVLKMRQQAAPKPGQTGGLLSQSTQAQPKPAPQAAQKPRIPTDPDAIFADMQAKTGAEFNEARAIQEIKKHFPEWQPPQQQVTKTQSNLMGVDASTGQKQPAAPTSNTPAQPAPDLFKQNATSQLQQLESQLAALQGKPGRSAQSERIRLQRKIAAWKQINKR
jgi:hypothetical protein